MFFLLSIVFIILFLFFLLFSTIKLEIKNMEIIFPKKENRNINKHYKICLYLCFLNKIKIFKTIINEEKIIKRGINQKFKQLQNNLIKSRNSVNIFDFIKVLNIDIEKLNLQVEFGMANAALTAISVGSVAGLLGFLLKDEMKRNDDVRFKTYPIYKNKDLLQIKIDGIFKIKKIHIIHVIIYILKQKRRVSKNVRPSNRGSYAYSNE